MQKCLNVNSSDLYRLEISSRFTVNFPIHSPMFYTRTCHFPLFAAAVERWLFVMRAHSVVFSTICTVYCRTERGDSRLSMTYARDRATPLLLSGFRALRSDRPCTYVLSRAYIRSTAYRKPMCTHMYISGMFARARDVPRVEVWDVLHKFNHHKNRLG